MIYPDAMFPDGTIHAVDLPDNLYAQLKAQTDAEGFVDASVGPVFGNYLMYAGYKVKVTIVHVTPTTYKVRLV